MPYKYQILGKDTVGNDGYYKEANKSDKDKEEK